VRVIRRQGLRAVIPGFGVKTASDCAEP